MMTGEGTLIKRSSGRSDMRGACPETSGSSVMPALGPAHPVQNFPARGKQPSCPAWVSLMCRQMRSRTVGRAVPLQLFDLASSPPTGNNVAVGSFENLCSLRHTKVLMFRISMVYHPSKFLNVEIKTMTPA